MLVAQTMAGAVVSATEIVWLHVAVLPQASVAVQVRVEASRFPGSELVTVVVTVMTTSLPLHVSVAVGRSKSQVAPHSTIRSGTQVIAGGVMSCTVMVWTHWLWLPQASVATQVRLMMKAPAQVPGVVSSLEVIVTLLSQASVAVALPLAATLVSAGQFKSRSAGQVITGGVMSCTVMV